MALLIYQIDSRRNMGPIEEVVDGSGNVGKPTEMAAGAGKSAEAPVGRGDWICGAVLIVGPNRE
jgi:hypothetical protein